MVVFRTAWNRRGVRTIAISIVLLISSSISNAAEHSPVDFRISVTGSTATYEGEISRAANAQLFSQAAEAHKAIETLHITSRGGDVEAGIELGDWVYDRNVDVHVSRLCASSCANYVFTAGRGKVLEKTALVAWHGGSLQEGLLDVPDCVAGEWFEKYFACDAEAFLEEAAASLSAAKASEDAFYRKIGVDQRITILGQLPEYACDNAGTTEGWYYSVSDLRLFGVENVEVIGGVWDPKPPEGSTVCRIEVQQLP